MNRREFLVSAAAPLALARTDNKSHVGIVQSTHPKLARPTSLEDPLDYERVRAMVWKAIEYGAPRAGSLAAKIKTGSWVVVKPNMVFMRPQPGYRTGDITDFRVTRAVIEYLARYSRASRITIAEGGSYRNLHDPAADSYVTQNGQRVDLAMFNWGPDEFPGVGGSVGGMLHEFDATVAGKRFDYIDLSYDAIRDRSGRFRRIEVPRTPRGVSAFGARSDYYVTNTLLNCDFIITVPVIKSHLQCGLTACLKNYVGMAPREAYTRPGEFHNLRMHDEHSVDNRIDPFIVDLVAFHPPDYCVADGIRGLQFEEHDIGLPDQMLRNNLIIAGEDPVALDATIARMMRYNPWDIDFLHLAARRDMGTMNPSHIDLRGDDLDRVSRPWGKPLNWYGRCNREWLITASPDEPLPAWRRYESATDTLDFARWVGDKIASGRKFGAAVRVHAEGYRNGYLWVGVRGRLQAAVNGQAVLRIESRTTYRVGQYRQKIELKPGANLFTFFVEALAGEVMLSALVVGPRNDGDTLEGVRWSTA